MNSQKTPPHSSDELKKRIEDAKKKQAKTSHNDDTHEDERKNFSRSLNYGFRLGVEMVSAMIIAMIIGYILDITFETLPLFMILFGFLGIAAGVNNIYKVVIRQSGSVGYLSTEDSKESKK